MYLICTGKVFKALNREPDTTEEKWDPYFAWSVGLFQVGRHKALLVVNNATLYCFVLYGIRATQFVDLGNFLRGYIKDYMLAERIAPEYVLKYLASLPTEECWIKAIDKGMTARLSKVSLDMKAHAELLDVHELLQLPMSKYLNSAMRGNGGRHAMVWPREDFERFLSERYGGDIHAINAIEMLVSVNQQGYIAWRKLHVPVHFTMLELHTIIQIVFDWRGAHSFTFKTQAEDGSALVYVSSDVQVTLTEEAGRTILNADTSSVGSVLMQHGQLRYSSLGVTEGEGYGLQAKRVVKNYGKSYALCIAGGGMVKCKSLGEVLFAKPEEEEPDIEINIFESLAAESSTYKEQIKERVFDLEQVNERLRKLG